ncbi:TPA: hypothetical protein ACPJ1P_003467 [Vibrio diabolicus]
MNKDQINNKAFKHRYRSIPIKDMLVDNTVENITQYEQIWKNGSGINRKINFKELEKYASSEHIKWLITRFESSGWSEASKVSNYGYIKRVFTWKYSINGSKDNICFSTDICSDFIRSNYLSMLANGVGVKGEPISGKSLGSLAAKLSCTLTKLGLRPIPKEKRNLNTSSAKLDSDNYSSYELKRVGRVLLKDHKLLLNKYTNEPLTEKSKQITFNRLIYNAIFLTIYYLGTGQMETINMYIDDNFRIDNLGNNRISIIGIKGRNNYKENEYSFIPKKSCKSFFDSHLFFSKTHINRLDSNKHFLFKKFDGNSPSSNNLYYYVKYLRSTYEELEILYNQNSAFSLNCESLKSTIKERMEVEKGRLHASLATRNSPSTFDAAKYSKTTETDAKRQLAIGVTTLQYLGENPSGGTKVAIARTKELIGEVLTPEEFNLLKRKTESHVERIANGGFCKGNESPQRNEFQKNMNKNELLSDDDKSHMGCGFVVKCFSCKNFGVVDDSNDIWRLLSFEQRLNEAMTLHKDLSHFIQNYGEIKLNIVELKKRFKKSHLKAAEMKLKREIHPLWDENSIEDILRG